MEKNNVPTLLDLTNGLLVISIRTLIGMLSLSECNFHLGLAKNQYAGQLYYMKTKKRDPIFNRPSALISVAYHERKIKLYIEPVYTAVLIFFCCPLHCKGWLRKG